MNKSINNNTKNFEYRQLKSDLLIIPEDYQRRLDNRRVKKIVSNFNPNLVNPIKVSHRDNQYYVFDGQHTLAALKLKNGNANLMVDCKIYEGLSEAEEAVLFAKQNGLSRQVESIAKFKALFTAGDVDIINMIDLTKKAGLYIDFSKNKATNRIIAVAKTYKIFKAVTAADYIEIFSIIKDTWNGIAESLNTEILGGTYLFYTVYKGKYDRKLLIKQLSKVSPIVIIREGKAYSGGGDMRFAKQIFNIYNKGLSTRRLKDEF